MSKRLVLVVLLVNLMLMLPLSPKPLANDQIWWNDDWSFSQEINIPINTSNASAKFQPIDIPIEFENPCWAKNEKEHSVRVILDNIIEKESQIYDLEFEKENYIKACNLVFLIPEEADGKEKYYVYYDDKAKPSPDYEDYVSIYESSYAIEPVPGFPFESRYLGINENGYTVYAVAQEGKFIGDTISQQVTKLKLGSEEVLPQNGEQLLSLDFEYWYPKNGDMSVSYTGEEFVSKKIYVDGNLMGKFGIVSKSTDGFFQTTIMYKYYYCPTDEKRIYAHVKHEIIKYALPSSETIELFYAALRSGGIRSNTIEELNFGRILPYLHIYGEDENILTYDVNEYPERGYEGLIFKGNDVDLGSRAWVSFDEGETGKAHAVILGSKNVLKSGSDERDGVQIIAYEGIDTEYQLPGLDPSYAFIYLYRNKYETGEEEDNKLPKEFIVEFDAEFFTTEDGGYKAVDEEASIFQSLIKYQPPSEDNITNGEEERERYSLTTYVHFAPSFPLGSPLSTLLNLNLSYICVELSKDNNVLSGTASRLPLVEDIDLDFKGKLLQQIKMVLNLFDWKNRSFFKRACFSDLDAGRYLVKIYRENRLFGKERQFIGYAIVQLEKNKTIRIFCRPEGKIKMSILNQHKTGLENAEIYLIKDDLIIADSQSEYDGSAVLGVPCSILDTYSLNVVYKGFLVHEEQVQVGFIRSVLPLEKVVSFEVHNLTINITDADGGLPEFDVDMELTSDEMAYPIDIPAEKVTNGRYNFINLYPADYKLRIRYKSFDIEETVNIPGTSSLTINLHNLIVNLTDKWGLPPEISLNLILTSDEFKKTVVIQGEQISAGEYLFSDLYPADYTLKLFYKSYVIENPVGIPYNNNGTYEMVFPAMYNVTTEILDARGDIKQGGRVLINRGGQEVWGIIDEKGRKTFYIPPGIYNVRIYSDDSLIAQRKIDVTDERTFTIVTSEEPLLPFVIIGLDIIILVGVAFLTYRKRDLMYFLKILVFALIIIAFVSPWWMLNGSLSDPHVETSKKIFLIPPELVTLTSTTDVLAGELVSINEEFVFIMNVVAILVILGCICVVLSILLKLYTNMRRLSLLSLLFAVVLFVGSSLIFLVGMSEFTQAGVGSVLGNGDVDINIPGERMYETLSCSWGPSIGFYLYLSSTIIVICIFFYQLKKIFLEKMINMLKDMLK